MEKLHTLIIKKDACKVDSENIVYIPELRLKKEGKLLDILHPDYFEEYYQIDSLKTGEYEIEFETLFKLTEVENIVLQENDIDTLTVCIDKIDYESVNHVPFIDRIGVDESFEMIFATRGCFHSFVDTIRVKRDSDHVFFQSHNKSKSLTQKEIIAFRQFEKELIHMNDDNCTTVDYYSFKYKDQTLKIADGSCQWNGLNRLYRKLFPETD